jgi:putative GTP pyrophosphokinase
MGGRKRNMKRDALKSILEEYDQKHALHTEFTEKTKDLVEDLLRDNSASIHSITCRTKKRKDLKTKIERSRGKYKKLCDVTDICGVRITTYFADEVDTVAAIIEKEFSIDPENSVDKRALLDPDRFGYLSLHYVCELPANRLKLTENQRFKECKVEIQVRSILQHTWAEIEHDLGYKSKQAVPRELRRRFSRLAGLLELADDEFIQIRDSLREYAASVPQKIIDSPESVLIDKVSLSEFVKASLLVRKIDQGIASLTAGKIVGEMGDKQLSHMVDLLHFVGLLTIADIDSSLRKFEEIIYGFAKAWMAGIELGKVKVGICLFYLCYVIVGRKNSVKQAYNYLNTINIGFSEERQQDAERIVSIYNQVADKKQKEI